MKFRLGLLLALLPGLAFAQQGGVLQSGTVTPGHPAKWVFDKTIGDGGGANNGSLTDVGVTNTGTPICINDAPITALGGYHQLCLGANALGGGLLTYNAYAGAQPLPFKCVVNGVTQSCLGGIAGGNVTGETPTVVGDVAVWANSGGTLIGEGPPVRFNIPSGDQTVTFLPTGNPITSLGSLNLHANSVARGTREYLTNIGFDVGTGVGGGASGVADKAGLYIGVVSHPGNGNLWAINPLVTISAGSSQGQYQTSEIDMNNNSAPPPTVLGPTGLGFGGPTAPGNSDPPPNGTSGGTYVYGEEIECSGDFPCTAGIVLAGANSWQRGVGCWITGFSQSCFYDYSASPHSIDIWGTHRHTIDLSNSIQTNDVDATSLLLPAEGNISIMSVVSLGTQLLALVGDGTDNLHIASGQSGGGVQWASLTVDAPLLVSEGIATRGQVSHGPGTIDAAAYYSSGVLGSTCSGAPSGSFAVTAGLVTHC